MSEPQEIPQGQVLSSLTRINNKWWIPPRGHHKSKIMIVCSHPSKDDLEARKLFGRGSGEKELENALKEAGIPMDHVWITSMVKYGIGSKDKPSGEQIAECSPFLDAEIAFVKPKLIIALGSEVFKRLMRKNIKISPYIGEIIDSPYSTDGVHYACANDELQFDKPAEFIKILPNYSVGNIYAVDPKLRPEFKDIFYLARRYVTGKLKYRDFKWIIVKDPATNLKILEKYAKEGKLTIGYDMEWEGEYLKGRVPHTFQYCCEPDKAIILPLLDEHGNYNKELMMSMKEFMERDDIDRLGWNIRADDKALAELGIHVKDETIGFDGMKAVAFFDSRWRKGLETGIKRFTEYPPYYNSLSEALTKHKLDYSKMSRLMFLEPDIFFRYCAGDAVSHYTACINMRDQLKTTPALKSVSDYYFEVYLPLTHYMLDMETTGLPIDLDVMEDITKKYTDCYNILYDKLKRTLNNFGFNTEAYDMSVEAIGEEATLANELYPDFNPRSTNDKRRLFFGKLGLEPVYYVKKGKVKPKAWYDKQKDFMKAQYSPSTNGKTMASLRFQLKEALEKDPDNAELQFKFDVVKNYLDLARVSVFAKKFLAKQGTDYEDISEDDDADDFGNEPDYALNTGAGASTAPKVAKPLKSSYWAALAQDGKIHADYFECLNNFRSSSKPNVQNPASKVLSHIPKIFEECSIDAPKNIRNIFYSGSPDWHFAEVDVAGADLAIAAFLSQDEEYIADILKGSFHVTKMREYFSDPNLSKNEASKYVTAKSITFRVAYTAGLMSAALPIQAEIYAENGNLVPIGLIEYALKTWERYTTYMGYRDQCNAQVENCQWIENARGMRYFFEETDNFAIKAGWMNESLAYPIASELALFMWDISVKLKERLKKDGLWMKYVMPVNVVHDANYWVIHKDLMKDMYFPEVCKQIFTKDVKIATGDNLGIEMVVNDRWKGKEKVFAKETKWNFETKVWEWEK